MSVVKGSRREEILHSGPFVPFLRSLLRGSQTSPHHILRPTFFQLTLRLASF